MNQNMKPESDKEWKINSLNIRGLFFQRLIISLIKQHRQLHLKNIDYPVLFPKDSNNTFRSESLLDVYAYNRYRFRFPVDINLLIECKKVNPNSIDWIFFPKYPPVDNPYVTLLVVSNEGEKDEKVNPTYEYETIHSHNFCVADEAIETQGNGRNVENINNEKTSNSTITDVSYQATLATHAIANEDYEKSAKRATDPPFIINFYIPIIVTTANLFVSEYDPGITSIETGEVPYEEVELKPIDKLFFEYSIPPHLQIRPDKWWIMDRSKETDRYTRRHILIVNSNHFEETMNWLINLQDIIVS